MKFLNIIDKIVLKIEEFILSGSIIVIAIMICANVISRQFFGPSVAFHSEVAKFAVVISTFMGISYAARKGRHISMSAIYDTVPWRVRKAMAIIIPLVTAFILFSLAYVSYDYVMGEYQRGTTTAYLNIPTYLMYMFIPLGFVMGGIQYVRNLIVNIFNKEVYIGTDALDYNDIKPEDRNAEDQMQV
ncbi:TRAP transporter small permease [Gracilibacillus kekensis]|uniref:TRAP-type C4-dicarboxylate transport system, small permease component n=1 Tax=Gracilibacillus kekensis TaxID=1027249 RepID=A0A1M7KGG0_9BACI|nr:TRAP transporter small permease [Gracilibacillus kekensis]SHM64384.1 TRAP-type C4-dicarboxylate transport system, small permease component [Gracilibacillus kekensis]